MNKNELIEIRDVIESDRNFILATFLKGLRYGNDTFGLIDSKVYFSEYQKIIDAILRHPDTSVAVACLKDDKQVILGYSIFNLSKSLLHFTFVKSAWRGIGIAKSLFPEKTTTVTHITKTGASIIRKSSKLVFNPFAI